MASALVDKVKSVLQPEHDHGSAGHCCSTVTSGPGYASPEDAQKGPREKLLYITAVYTGPLLMLFSRLQVIPCASNPVAGFIWYLVG